MGPVFTVWELEGAAGIEEGWEAGGETGEIGGRAEGISGACAGWLSASPAEGGWAAWFWETMRGFGARSGPESCWPETKAGGRKGGARGSWGPLIETMRGLRCWLSSICLITERNCD
jgi:hypothetical protein